MNCFFKLTSWRPFIFSVILLAPLAAWAQAAPNITQQPTNQTVALGSNAVFSVVATSGQTPLTYRWSFNGTNLSNNLHIGGATNSILTASNIVLADGGNYQVVVTDRNNRNTTSSVAMLTVGLAPTITLQPTGLIKVTGSTATFSANASGTAPLILRWFRDGVALTNNIRISGATNSTALTITGLLTGDSGNYTFKATNAFGSVTSSVASLDVKLTAAAIIRYVNLNNSTPAPPYGSWSNAATNIQDAIDVAGAGEQILVTNGVYANSSREIPFSGVTNRVVTAVSLAISSVNGADVTVIDGGGLNRCIYLTNGATLTGFTLANGHSQDGGGGATCVTTNAVLLNCVLTNNYADGSGGGVNNGTLINCLLVSNNCAFGGGAANSVLINCTLLGNSGSYGGGAAWTTMFSCQVNSNYSGSIGGGVSSCTLNNCSLTGNVCSQSGGAAVYSTLSNCVLNANSANAFQGGGAFSSTLYNCTLADNGAGQWGGNVSECTMYNCWLTRGTAFRGGGAMNSTLTSCTLSNNTAIYGDGGGAYASTLTNCVITANAAWSSGGGANNCLMYGCLVSSNWATDGGGVLNGTLSNCALIGNSGGGIYTGQGGAAQGGTLYNCLLNGNTSVRNGGGTVSSTLVNCTVVGNSASGTGGGCDSSTLTNCIVYNNAAAGGGANYSGSTVASYTCTTPLPAGSGNFSSAPIFANQAAGNYRLYPGSPCIDTGNNAVVPVTLDLDGNTRIINSTVDVGAYEFQNFPFITTQPQSQSVPFGEPSVSFNVAAFSLSSLTYQWRFNGTNIAGATNSSLTLNFIQFSDAGNYSVLVLNGSGSMLSSNAVLTVTPAIAPQIVTSPASQTSLTNVNIALNASVTGAPTPALRWYFNGVTLTDDARHTGTATSTLNVLNTQTNDTGNYWLVATNVAGSATSSVASVTVLLPPAIVLQPATQTVPTGSSPAFNTAVTGGNPLSYQWYFNGTPLTDGIHISGATTTNLIIANAQFADSGNYVLIATNPVGSATSAPAVLTALSPPIFLTQPIGSTNAVNSAAGLVASVTGSAPISYQWLFNGAALTNDSRISGMTATNLAITGLLTNDSGNYQLVAANAIGVVTSAVAYLDVEIPPSITQSPGSQTNITHVTAAFTVTATGTAPLRYQWYFNGNVLTNDTRISGATGTTLSISNLQTTDAGNYVVIVTNWVGSATGAVATLTIIPPPVITLQPANLLGAVGSNLIFTASATTTSPPVYQWLFDGAPLTNGSHYAGADTTALTILSAVTNDIGGYQFVVTDIGGSVTSSVASLNVLYPPIIIVPPLAQAVGAGSNGVFTVVAGGDGPFFYHWRFNGANLAESAHISGSTNGTLTVSNLVFADTGNYDVVVSNLVGVVVSPAAALTVNIAPVITAQPAGRAIALGLALNLPVAAVGTAPLAYQWSLNGTVLPGVTSATYSIPAMTTNDYGIYQIIVTNAFGAVTSAPVQIAPSQLVAWGNNFSGQTNLPLNLTNIAAITAGGGPYTPANGPSGFNLVLLANGSLKAWGNNSGGQTNIPADATNIVAIAAGGTHCLALRANGTVLAWGLNTSGQTNVPLTLSNVVVIAAGGSHSIALRSDGKVFCWGLNNFGQTTVPTTLTRVVSIGAGPFHSLAVRADGTVVAWGLNTNDRQLTGAGPAVVPVPAGLVDIKQATGGYYHDLVLRTNGTVYCWASTNYGLNIIPASTTNVTAIAAGNYFNLALRGNGLVTAWGLSEYSQTNVPAGLSSVIAIAAGPAHGLALVNDGHPLITQQPVGGTSWPGRNFTLAATVVGQSPLALQWQFNGTNISGATNAVLALTNLDLTQSGNYQLLVSNPLGAAASVPVPLTLVSNGLAFLSPLPALVTNFVGGKLWLNAAVAGNGPVSFQWRMNGANISGATNEDLVLEPLVQTNGGVYSVIATNALTGGSVTSLNSTQQVALIRAWGYLATSPTNAALTNIVGVAAGYAGVGTSSGYYWGLRADGKLIGWGTSLNAEGTQPSSVSNFTITAVAAGYNHTLALRSDGYVVDWGQNFYGVQAIPVAASSIITIAAGDYHDLALRSDGTVVVWGGMPGYSVTNVPANATNIVAIAAGNNASYALRLDGKVINWGLNSTAPPATLSNVVTIACGANSTTCYALKADGTVTNWGGNKITIPADWTNIVAISAAYQHANALRADGVVLMIGNYYSGTVAVPSGTENVVAIASGGDHDLALFSPRTPGITLQPFNRTLLRGTDTTFHARAASPVPASYQWYFNGTPLAGATNPSVTINNVQLNNSGAYQLVVSNRYGIATSKPGKLIVTLPLRESLDFSELNDNLLPLANWSTSSNAAWFGQATTTHDGVDAAQSGAIGHSQETILQNVVTNTDLASGMISFWWKVSSEAVFDTLEFRLNGVTLATISGEAGWEQRYFELPVGTNVLQWRYSRDASGADGQNAAWVDQFNLTFGKAVITTQPAGLTVNAGDSASFNVAALGGGGSLTYYWRQNVTNTVGGNSPLLTLDNVTRAHRGAYSCLVSNADGTTISSDAALTVLSPQVLGATKLLPDGSFQFTSSDANGVLLQPSDLANFEVQATTNLVDWVTLPGALSLTNGMLQLQDTGKTNWPSRFYRIIEH